MKKIMAICFVVCLASFIFSASVLAAFDVWKVDIKTQEITRVSGLNSNDEFTWATSPDGNKVVLAQGNTLNIYDLAGKLVSTFTLSAATALEVVDWGTDGIAVLETEDTMNLLVLDDKQFRPKSQVEIDDVYSPVISRDRNFVAFTADDGQDYYLGIFDLKGNKGLSTDKKIAPSIYIWSPDSKLVAALSDDSETLIYDLSGKLVNMFSDYMPLSWSPDDKYLLICSYSTGDMVIVDRKDWSTVQKFPTILAAFGEWSNDLKNIAFADFNSDSYEDGISLWLIDMQGNKVRLTDYADEQIINFKWSSDGKYVLFVHDDIYEKE